jgi:hypothetical protein
MTLLSTLTTTQLNSIRSGHYHQRQLVALVPNDNVVQFTPSAAPTDGIFAQIAVGTVSSGSMSDIASFQRVIFSTSADVKATEFYRTYVRKVSGTSTLYIGQCAQAIDTSTVITVQNAYDIVERPRVQRDGTEYSDWEIAPRRLLPTETALPSAVVLVRGDTTYNPTASPAELDASAISSFTHAWSSSNSSDSVVDEATASPTFTLNANDFRWIRYTFTDSNGNSGLRVIPVWTVPKDLSASVNTAFVADSGDVASIQRQDKGRQTCTVTAFDGIDSLLPGTMCAVFTDDWYDGTHGAIRSNIDFIGYLARESTSARGQAQLGRVSDTTFDIESLTAVMARTPIATFAINSTSSVTKWGDIESPTPARVTHYALSEHSTIPILCSIAYPDSDTDFVADGEFFYSDERNAQLAVESLLDPYKARLQTDKDGRIDFARSLRFRGDTARDAADTVVQFTPDDVLDWEFVDDPVQRIGLLTVNGGSYSTSAEDYRVRRAFAPSIADIRGADEIATNNQLFSTNTTEVNFETEVKNRTANIYAANQSVSTIRATLKDEWHFLVPDVGVWFTFDIALTDTARGITYGSNDRWELTSVSVSSNNETGRKQVTATFRIETQSTGAEVDVVTPKNTDDMNLDMPPATLPPYTGADQELTDDDYFGGSEPPGEPPPPESGCELLGLRPKTETSGVDTEQTADLTQRIVTTVRGSGTIKADGSIVDEFGIDVKTEDFTYSNIVLERGITYRVEISNNVIYNDALDITNSSGGSIEFDPGGVILPEGNVSGNTYFWLIRGNGSLLGARFVDPDGDYSNNGNFFAVDILGPTKTDAFYEWVDGGEPTAHGTGNGLLVNGNQPSGIPPYNDNHEYEFLIEADVTGPVIYEFNSPYTLSQMSNWSLQIRACFLEDSS